MKTHNIFTPTPIDDLKTIPQSGSVLGDGISGVQKKDFSEYTNKFFSPWRQVGVSIARDELAKRFISDKPKYGEDFAIKPQEWYEELLDNADISSLGAVNQKAIIIENTYLRAVPIHKPAYYNPTEPGEGYPFDTLQENLLFVGEPVFISHYTKDGEYVLVETNALSYGFVKAKHLALVMDKDAEPYMQMQFAAVVKDNLKLYDQAGLKQNLYLGAFLPFKDSRIILPGKNPNGYLKLQEFITDDDSIILKPLSFSKSSIAGIINMLIGKPYGWGGYLMNRDCAQLLKDYFATFGIFIPIWSGNQAKAGRVISMDNISNYEKAQLIKDKAIPCQTILYRKGHVVLYLGEYNGEIVIFHALWGIKLYDKSGSELRHIVGKSVITTLEYGKELDGYRDEDNLISMITSMSIFD